MDPLIQRTDGNTGVLSKKYCENWVFQGKSSNICEIMVGRQRQNELDIRESTLPVDHGCKKYHNGIMPYPGNLQP